VKSACFALFIAFATLIGAGCADNSGTPATESLTGVTSGTTPEPTTDRSRGEFTAERDAAEQVEAILSPPPIVERADQVAQLVADAVAPEGEGDSGGVTVQTVELGEPTVILIEVRGLADDSVAGYDLRLTLDPDDTLGWGVVSATRRDLCLRGVSGGLCA